MRTFLIIISFLVSSNILFSQELNIGGIIGTASRIYDFKTIAIGGTVEYRPAKSILSLNSDPTLWFNKEGQILTVPVYLKFIIGNKLRFCPAFGGFVRSNANYGLTAGLGIEFKVKERLLIYVKSDYCKEFWKADAPDHLGIVMNTRIADHHIL